MTKITTLTLIALLASYKRRPRRPPLRRVVSVGIGVTSSIRPIFIPERARARSAAWRRGMLILYRFCLLNLSSRARRFSLSATSCAKFNMKSSNSNLNDFSEIHLRINKNLFATFSNVLSSKHSCVWTSLIPVSFYTHSSSNLHNSFTSRKISDMHKSIVERSEDVGNTKDILTLKLIDKIEK